LAGKLDIKREGHIIKIGEYQSYLTEEIAYLNKKIDCLTDILADI